MERLIRGLFEGGMSDYNCSGEDPNRVNQPQYVFGIYSILYGFVAMGAYGLCIKALTHQELVKIPCYQIMLFLGVIDIVAILMCAVVCGLLFLEGAVFCTRPILIYTIGCIGTCCWCGSCLTCFLLVCNRLCGLQWPHFHWEPVHIRITLALASAYALYFLLFTRPAVHNSDNKAWFFDPMIKSQPPRVYESWSHTANNLIVVVLTAIAYVVFVIIVRSKYKKHNQKFSLKGNPIVVQVVLMSSFNMAASLIYFTMQFHATSTWLVVAGQVTWQLTHGCPAFIYLCLNRTIRSRVVSSFGRQKAASVTAIFSVPHASVRESERF